MKKIILPLVLVACFFGESIFVGLFPAEAFSGQRIIVPRFLLTALILMAIYYVKKRTLLYAFIFGLLYDAFYTEVLGVYLFLFPFAVYLTSKIMKILHTHLIMAGVITIVNITIVEFFVYEFNVLVLNAEMTLTEFGDIRLWPTLVLNLAFFIIFSYPLKELILYMKKIEFES